MDIANQIYGAIDSTTEPETGLTDADPTAETDIEAEATPEVQEPDEANPAPTRVVKAELDGREIELEVLTDDVDLELIPKGLMMEKAFRQKTMALADERREFESQKSDLDQKLLDLNDQIQFDVAELESEDMQQLKEDYPDEFEKARLKVEKKLSKFKAFQEERGKELLEQQKAIRDADRAQLSEVIPEWLDEKAIKADYKKMGDFLKSYGVQEEELEGIFENSGSVTLATIRKAALYDEIQAATVKSKVSRKSPKTSKPNSTSSQENSQKREKTYAEILYG